MAEHHRRVVRYPAVRDVRGRQVRHAPVAMPGRDHGMAAAKLGKHARVGELDALGRPGGARGVDQRQDILRPDRTPGRLEVEAAGRLALEIGQRHRPRSPVDADEGLNARAGRRNRGKEELLGDHDLVARVAEEIADLLGGRGVVDRERHRAEVQRGGVHERELGPVQQHDPHGVARLDAECCESGRDPAYPVAVLTPADLLGSARCAQCDHLAAPRHRALERLAQAGDVEPVRHSHAAIVAARPLSCNDLFRSRADSTSRPIPTMISVASTG